MTQVGNTMTNVISRGFKFYIKQDRDWRITAIRSNLAMFLYKTVLPYVSIYVMALGATGTQLGIVNSIGMIVAGIFGPLGGWLTGLVSRRFTFSVS
jgi:MFS family permease